MERMQNTLKKTVEEVHDLKTEMQELMFEAEKEEHDIVKQSTEIEEPVSVFEETIDQLDLTIKICKCVTAQTEEKKKVEHDAQLREKKVRRGNAVRKSQARAKAKIREENRREKGAKHQCKAAKTHHHSV